MSFVADGWFPKCVMIEEAIFENPVASGPDGANMEYFPQEVPLSALSRIFWMSKGFDYDVSLSYVTTTADTINPPAGSTATGNITASGTIDNSLSPALAVLPNKRACVAQWPFWTWSATDAGTLVVNDGAGHIITTPYSVTENFDFETVTPMQFQPKTSVVPFILVDAFPPSTFKTVMGPYLFSAMIHPSGTFYGTTNIPQPLGPGGGQLPMKKSGATAILQMDGSPIQQWDIYVFPDLTPPDHTTSQTIDMTGTVTVDFNQWWNP